MPDDQSSLDARVKSLDYCIERLRQYLSPRQEFLQPVRPRSTGPLDTVRIILILFAIAAGVAFVSDAIAICLVRDEYVTVIREKGQLQVWQDGDTFEAGTGKKLTEHPREDTAPVVRYHDARRNRALESVTGHLLLLILSLVALRKLCQGQPQVDSTATPASS